MDYSPLDDIDKATFVYFDPAGKGRVFSIDEFTGNETGILFSYCVQGAEAIKGFRDVLIFHIDKTFRDDRKAIQKALLDRELLFTWDNKKNTFSVCKALDFAKGIAERVTRGKK